MRLIALLLAVGISACDRAAPENSAGTATPSPDATLPTQGPASQPAAVIPKPEDQAQLDRMILAGYTPHADHLHPPGVNECPLTTGSDVVM